MFIALSYIQLVCFNKWVGQWYCVCLLAVGKGMCSAAVYHLTHKHSVKSYQNKTKFHKIVFRITYTIPYNMETCNMAQVANTFRFIEFIKFYKMNWSKKTVKAWHHLPLCFLIHIINISVRNLSLYQSTSLCFWRISFTDECEGICDWNMTGTTIEELLWDTLSEFTCTTSAANI